IGLSTRTLRSIAPSSTWATLYLRPSSADFITIIAESNFRYRQPAPSLRTLWRARLATRRQHRRRAVQFGRSRTHRVCARFPVRRTFRRNLHHRSDPHDFPPFAALQTFGLRQRQRPHAATLRPQEGGCLG